MSQQTILVGVDGPEASLDALRWAVDQAKASRATLSVVTAWHYPAGESWGLPKPLPEWNVAIEAANSLRSMIKREVTPDASIRVKQRVVEGHPAPVLVDLSRDADLLVVGSRGHGAFEGMLLGSVSAHCASNAACPVVVVRHQRHSES